MQNKAVALEATQTGSVVLVLWVGEGAGTGLAVITETPDDAVESRRAALAPIALRVVTAALNTHYCYCATVLESPPPTHTTPLIEAFGLFLHKGHKPLTPESAV